MMRRKWLIVPKKKMSVRQRERYWSGEHENDEFYKNVWGISDDPVFLEKITAELNSLPNRKRILLPGCGSLNTLQNHIADNVRGIEKIVCADFEKAVETAKSKNSRKEVFYEAKNCAKLGYKNEFEAVLSVNSLVSESDSENRRIVASCADALVPGGTFMAVVPTISAAVEIAFLDRSKKHWLELIDMEKFSLREPNQKIWQIFYTPLLLRRIIKEAGMKIRKLEILFFDSPLMRKRTKKHYAVTDADICVYELFAVAEKS